MRVLLITGEFPPMQGGVGDCTNETARALAARGVEVGVLTSTHAASNDPAFQNSRGGFSLQPLVKGWDWSSLRIIAQTIRDFEPSIVHLQFQTAAFGMHPAVNFIPRLLSGSHALPFKLSGSRSARERYMVTFHDLRVPYLFPKAGRVRDWVMHELAHSSDAVIATNDEDHSQLLALHLKLLALIPIGSNISTTLPPIYQRSAWRAQLGVGDNETLLCYFGFLNESKGGETLIRALALVPSAKLLMIGGQVGASDSTNAAYLAKVKALIAELGLTQRVLWTDYTPQQIVTANFFASDLCVMPYREGAAFRHGTLMAALAHGMPIITTRPRVETMQAIALRNGENCLLVPPADSQALADAIQRASALPGLRAQLGAGARELAQHFTWDKIAQQHLEFYQQTLL